jgi:hypothetical protein
MQRPALLFDFGGTLDAVVAMGDQFHLAFTSEDPHPTGPVRGGVQAIR